MESIEVWKENFGQKNCQETLQKAVYFLKNGSESDQRKVIQCLFNKESEPARTIFNVDKNTLEESNELFNILYYNTVSIFTQVKTTKEDILVLASHLEILSQFVNYLPALTLYDLRFITNLSKLLIERFPELELDAQTNAAKALNLCFQHVHRLGKNFQKEYFSLLFHHGILLSCSSSIFFGLELEDIQTFNKPATYFKKNILWQSLFEFENNPTEFQEEIFSEFVTVLISFFENFFHEVKQEDLLKDPNSTFLLNLECSNLVGLCVNIFEKVKIDLYPNQLDKILKFLIGYSYKNPNVSGFYKLIDILFKRIKNLDCINQDTIELCQKYLSHTVKIILTLLDDVKLFCIHLIFNAPFDFKSSISIDELISVFDIAFGLDKNNCQLALFAVENLEKYREILDSKNFQKISRSILFNLKPYLIKQACLKNSFNSNRDLEIVQKKILSLYSYDDNNFLIDYLSQKDPEENSLFDEKNSLNLEFLFSTSNVEIFFDKFLENFSDVDNFENRHTKFSACELLHNSITFILGNQLTERYLKKKLFLVILKAGCNSDDAIKNLFHPLVEQLIHYLSLKPLSTSQESQELVDALTEGLTTDFNLHFRNYCSQALKKFICSVKERSTDDRESIEYLIDKIMNLLASEKSSALTLFEHLHPHLEEKEKSAGKNSKKKNIILEKLKSAINWLLNQCCSLNEIYRRRCIVVLQNFVQIIFDTSEEFVEFYRLEDFNKLVLKGFKSDFDNRITADVMRSFLKSLELYSWFFNQTFVEPALILMTENCSETKIFYEYFGKILSEINSSDKNLKEEIVQDVILNIFDFTISILIFTNEEDDLIKILDNFWNDDFSRLLHRLALSPRSFKIQPLQLEKLFNMIKERVPNKFLKKLENFFFENENYSLQYLDFQNITRKVHNIRPLKDFVKGITLLSWCNAINFEELPDGTSTNYKEIILTILDFLRTFQENNQKLDRPAEAQFKEYLVDVFRFCLVKFQPDLLRATLDEITKDPSINILAISNQSSAFELFRSSIYEFVLKNPAGSLAIVNEFINDHPDKMLILLEDIFIFANQNEISLESLEILAKGVLSNFSSYEKLVGENNQRFSRLFNIVKFAISSVKNPEALKPDDDHLERWILKEFENARNLEEKSFVLESFFPYLNLEPLMDDLRDSDLEIWLRKLKEDKYEKLWSIMCLQTLIKILATSKSWIVFKGILRYCAGACEIFTSEDVSLQVRRYFDQVSDEDVFVNVQEIHSMFASLNLEPQQRLDILDDFLLPALQVKSEKFFETFRKDCLNLVSKKLPDDDVFMRIQDLVTKIGCFKILEQNYVAAPQDETLTSFLMTRGAEINEFEFKFPEEREFGRLLHCAVFNCMLAVACSDNQEHLYDAVFREVVWEKIVDRSRIYDLSRPPTASTMKLEKDELNEHECVAMVTKAIHHYFNSDPTRKKPCSTENLPNWMVYFSQAFSIKNPNVIILLIRVVSNLKALFVYYLPVFFKPIVEAVSCYLETNPMNYLVRDMLGIFTDESYVPKYEELNSAQNFIEILITKVMDPRPEVSEYNFELLEKLMVLWADKLKVPKNLDDEILKCPETAVRVVLILFKLKSECEKLKTWNELNRFIRKKMFNWLDPGVPVVYETLGYIMSRIDKVHRDAIMEEDLFPENGSTPRVHCFFLDIQRYSNDLCIHLIHRLTLGCPELAVNPNLRRFTNPRRTHHPERKAECFSIILKAIPYLLSNEVGSVCEGSHLLETLSNENFPNCKNVCLEIIQKLVQPLDAQEVVKYLLPVKEIAKSDAVSGEEKILAYQIIVDVYEKFLNASNLLEIEIAKTCKKSLIAGLSDPDAHKLVLSFWKRHPDLPATFECRMSWLLQMYDSLMTVGQKENEKFYDDSEMHPIFAQFACLLLLDLAVESANDDNFLFAPLVEDCEHEVYEIEVHREWNPHKRVVKLGTDLALSLEYQCRILENCEGSNDSRKIPDSLRITLSKREFPQSPKYPDVFSAPVDSNPQIKSIPKFIRKYRTGEYPHISIRLKEAIETVENHARNDRDFAVSVLLNLMSSVKMSDEIENAISEVCTKILKKPSEFAPVAIEMLYRTGCKNFNADDIVEACKSMSCEGLGILLLERQTWHSDDSVYLGPNQKKLIGTVKGLQYFVQLASLYDSIGEHDTVTAIFKNWNLLQSDDLRQAYLAESNKNWLEAKDSYEYAYEIEFGFSKNYCMEGALRCLSELSSWDDIINKVYASSNCQNLESILQNSRKDKLLPWFITGQLNKTLEKIVSNQEVDNNNELLSILTHCNPEQRKIYGDELSIININKNPSDILEAKKCLESFFDGAYQRWVNSSVITDEPHRRLLDDLKSYNEINKFLKAIENEDGPRAVKEFLDHWKKAGFLDAEEVSKCSKIVNRRMVFGFWLEGKIKDDSTVASQASSIDLGCAILKQNLKISAFALKSNNPVVFQKYSGRLQKFLSLVYDINNDELIRINNKLHLLMTEYKFSRAGSQANTQANFQSLLEAWKNADTIKNDENVALSTRIKASNLVFEITKSFQQLLLRSPECIKLAYDESYVTETLNADHPEQIENALSDYSHEVLKNNCLDGSNEMRARNYLRLAEYYYEMMAEGYDRNYVLRKDFAKALMTAMSFGSKNAAKYFPAVLDYQIFKDDERMTEDFKELCRSVPSWMFLFWQEQIILHLTTPLKSCIIPIIQRLVVDYPNAITYSFENVYETYPLLREDKTIEKLYKSMFEDSEMETYYNAIKNLCQPEQFLKHQLLDFIQVINAGGIIVNAASSLLDKVFSISKNKGTSSKNVFTEPLVKYKNELKKLKSETNAENCLKAKANALKLIARLDKDLRNRIKIDESRRLLKNFSSYLENFVEKDLEIEVPGQYSEFGKPLPNHHAKVFKFVSNVSVIKTSEHVHIKIKIIGTNGKIYAFVVKCGIDLRRDQRLQQLFKISQEILMSDLKCKQLKLVLKTYSVLPFSQYMGLIEWVEDAKSLSEIIQTSSIDKSITQNVKKNYQLWIEASSENASKKSRDFIYRQAVKMYDSIEVVNKMNEFAGCFDRDLVRKTLLRISSTLYEFLQLRRNFTLSYATMSLIHWLTGVGNRDLDNTLVDLKTGRCIGINFGTVFGTGLEQPVPELVPFRLTTQILDLLRPFTERDSFGFTMTHTLRAMRSEKQLFLSCVKVIVNEPINWYQKLNEQWHKENSEYKDAVWSPEKKFAFADKKLSGMKPTNILIDMLSLSIGKNEDIKNEDVHEYLEMYKFIVNGKGQNFITTRSCIKNDDLTPEEQVKCLLDIATDANVLGRMCATWNPFI